MSFCLTAGVAQVSVETVVPLQSTPLFMYLLFLFRFIWCLMP